MFSITRNRDALYKLVEHHSLGLAAVAAVFGSRRTSVSWQRHWPGFPVHLSHTMVRHRSRGLVVVLVAFGIVQIRILRFDCQTNFVARQDSRKKVGHFG